MPMIQIHADGALFTKEFRTENAVVGLLRRVDVRRQVYRESHA
jgi:hypothetical protein